MTKRPPLALAVQSMGLLPGAIRSKVSGEPVTKEGRTLDPEIQLLLRGIAKFEALTGSENGVENRRKQYRLLSVGGTPYDTSVEVSGISIPTDDGPIKARVYRPGNSAKDLPLIAYFHGGGWVIGDLDTHDSSCRALSAEANVVVVSIDYRLAPEHKYPAAVNDAVSAVRYISQNLDRFNSSGPVAVMGDSAGGNLSTVVANDLAATVDAPDLQVLIYPATDLGHGTKSMEDFGEGFFLTEKEMVWFRSHYLTDVHWDLTDERVSPLRSVDLRGKPPAIVITAGFDPLRDEGHGYAKALAEAGNEVFYRCYNSFTHGFYNFLSLKSCTSEVTKLHNMIGDVLHGRIAMDELISQKGEALDESSGREQKAATPPSIDLTTKVSNDVPQPQSVKLDHAAGVDLTDPEVDITDGDEEKSVPIDEEKSGTDNGGSATITRKTLTASVQAQAEPKQRTRRAKRSDRALSTELRYGQPTGSTVGDSQPRRSEKPTNKQTQKPSSRVYSKRKGTAQS